MSRAKLTDLTTDLVPLAFLERCGEVFHCFDQQDSGNVSYGVRVGGEHWFVKTAGDPDAPVFLDHAQRVALLNNAVQVWNSCTHPALSRLQHVISSPQGPLLIYEWLEGELINVPSARRSDPDSAYQRFRGHPDLAHALATLFDAHAALAAAGWVACDLYDGCLMWDGSELRLIDIDHYQSGPFTNTMGRLFGSDRFMAPEEFELGARIDERTTVFNLGRFVFEFMGDGSTSRAAFRGSEAQWRIAREACAVSPAQRLSGVADLHERWRLTL